MSPVRLTHAVADRWLRERLVQLREQRSFNQDDAAKRADISKRTLIRIENGNTPIDPDILDNLLEAYKVDAKQKRSLATLRKTSIRVGWWDSYADVLSLPYADWCECEQEAKKISLVSNVIPGFLQTARYARFAQSVAISSHSGERADRLIALRLERQERLFAAPKPIRVILDESAIVRSAGDGVMEDQVDHLLMRAQTSKTEIRVMPFNVPILITQGFHLFHVYSRQIAWWDGYAVEMHSEDREMCAKLEQAFNAWWPASVTLTDYLRSGPA